MKIKCFFKHLNLVNKHRLLVFKLSIKAGIPFRGLIHDISKYSPIEFFEGIKYYDGNISPIKVCKKENGYSKAWLHHKGRNKHHFEYWYDFNAPDKTPIIPYKYTVEMICDTIAASMAYNKDNWNPKINIEYFNNRKDLDYINPKIQNILRETYKQIDEKGLNKTITKKNLQKIYYKFVEKKED